MRTVDEVVAMLHEDVGTYRSEVAKLVGVVVTRSGSWGAEDLRALVRAQAEVHLSLSLLAFALSTGRVGPTVAAEMVAAERRRQIEVEGWTPLHDDGHRWGDLAAAAACYAMPPERREMVLAASIEHGVTSCPEGWPFGSAWWKPCPDDRLRELVKAGALITAEIERLLRMAAREVRV